MNHEHVFTEGWVRNGEVFRACRCGVHDNPNVLDSDFPEFYKCCGADTQTGHARSCHKTKYYDRVLDRVFRDTDPFEGLTGND